MKRLKSISILSAGILFFCISCKKETITTGSLYVPATSDVTLTSTLAELQQGRTLYINNCGSCHSLYSPDSYSSSGWKGMMSNMASRAGLSVANTNLISKYVCRGK